MCSNNSHIEDDLTLDAAPSSPPAELGLATNSTFAGCNTCIQSEKTTYGTVFKNKYGE